MTSYASVGIGRFSRMLSYIHSCRRILGGAPLVPATHDAGIEPRYVPNLSSASASSQGGGSTSSTCVALRLRSSAGTTTRQPRSRRNPAHALSRNLWTGRLPGGVYSATTHDPSSSLMTTSDGG